MLGLAGSRRRGQHKSCFVSPPVPHNGTERNYLFSKRLSRLTRFHVAEAVDPSPAPGLGRRLGGRGGAPRS